MSDLLEGADPETAALLEAEAGRKQCKEPGCSGWVALDAAPSTRYCPEHFRGASSRRAGKEKAPKVVVSIQGKHSSDKQKETARGAATFMTMVGSTFMLAKDEVCATAIVSGAEQWGEAVAELSKYQPWLASVFAPAAGDNQVGAWVGLFMASLPILLPVLAHHNLLPDSIGTLVGGVAVQAQQAQAAGADSAA